MRVYKLSIDNYYYFGSTKCDLKERLRTHKIDYERINSKLYNTIKELGGWGNVKIELVLECENSREEEDKLIDGVLEDPFCLNERRAVNQGRKIYAKRTYETNKEHYKEKASEWANQNIEKRRQIEKKYRESMTEEQKAKAKERNKRYREKNRDKINQRQKERRKP